MVFSIFLDINIIIDYFFDNRKHHNEAKKIMDLVEREELVGCISESVINTSAYLLSKEIPISELKDHLSEMVSIMKVLPCSNRTIQNAYHNAANDLEDSVLYQIALENKLDYFITSDTKDFKRLEKAALPVIKPIDFISLLSSKKIF